MNEIQGKLIKTGLYLSLALLLLTIFNIAFLSGETTSTIKIVEPDFWRLRSIYYDFYEFFLVSSL